MEIKLERLLRASRELRAIDVTQLDDVAKQKAAALATLAEMIKPRLDVLFCAEPEQRL